MRPDTTTEAGRREATIILARHMPDWEIQEGKNVFWIIDKKADIPLMTVLKGSYAQGHGDTLYDSSRMRLAARVLSHLRDRYDDIQLTPQAERMIAWAFTYSPDGQRIALDSMLTLVAGRS